MKSNLCTVRTSYKSYSSDTENPVSLAVYMEILYGFFVFLIKELFAAREISLPCRLGTIQVIGKKRKAKLENGRIIGLSPDWKETNKLWGTCQECKENKQLVFHFNEHTNGVRYKFLWLKKNVLVENKRLYYFKPARQVKRTLAKLIKEGKEFFVI